MQYISFDLEPVPPFRLDLTVWAIRRRPDNTIDLWDGTTYRRALVLSEGPVAVYVAQIGPPDAPRLRVVASGAHLGPDAPREVASALDRLLGTRVNLTEFYRLAAADPHLDNLARRFRGLKPPRFPTAFEALVNAIACQQITLTLGIRILGKLAAAYGARAVADGAVAGGEATLHALPGPADVVDLSDDELRTIGFSRQKARALVAAGRAVVEGWLSLDGLAALDDEAAVARLRELPGVGRWTAEYVLLRGLGRTNVFPGDDVGARNNIQHWLGIETPLDYAGVRRVVAEWQPHAGLVYFHLLLERLDERGLLTPRSPESTRRGSSEDTR